MSSEVELELELEVAVAAQAAARLAQERTQVQLRRVAVLTAVVLLLLAVATLAYVVVTSGKAQRAADAAVQASESNTAVLALLRSDAGERQADAEERTRQGNENTRSVLAELEKTRRARDEQVTAQLELVLELLTAEVRDPVNQENRPAPSLPPPGHARPSASAAPNRPAGLPHGRCPRHLPRPAVAWHPRRGRSAPPMASPEHGDLGDLSAVPAGQQLDVDDGDPADTALTGGDDTAALADVYADPEGHP